LISSSAVTITERASGTTQVWLLLRETNATVATGATQWWATDTVGRSATGSRTFFGASGLVAGTNIVRLPARAFRRDTETVRL